MLKRERQLGGGRGRGGGGVGVGVGVGRRVIPATVRAGTDSLLIQKETCDSTTTMINGTYVWMR